MPKELKETMDKQPKEVRTWYMNKMRLSVKGIKKKCKKKPNRNFGDEQYNK